MKGQQISNLLFIHYCKTLYFSLTNASPKVNSRLFYSLLGEQWTQVNKLFIYFTFFPPIFKIT